MVFEITLGLWLAIVTQINHVNEEVRMALISLLYIFCQVSWLEDDVAACDWYVQPVVFYAVVIMYHYGHCMNKLTVEIRLYHYLYWQG